LGELRALCVGCRETSGFPRTVSRVVQQTAESSSPGRLLWWRLVSVRECLQEGYDLVFLFIGQPQISNRRVPVLRDLRIWPARHLLSSSAILTTREFVARVVEVDDFLQALEVAIVHVGLDEVGARPLVHIPQRRDLELAVELRSEPYPVGIWIEP